MYGSFGSGQFSHEGVGIACALPGGMDAVSFAMKRAHLGWERFGRKMLKPFQLTPARFDLLNTIRDWRKPMTQSELRKRLGVVRSAVSEMIAALEKLGLMRRTRGKDKRTWQVKLTKRGRLLAKAAYAVLVGNGEATARVNYLITGGDGACDPNPVRYGLAGLCFDLGRRLGNRVRRNRNLYCWDHADIYSGLLRFT